jgi:hypothetical protein
VVALWRSGGLGENWWFWGTVMAQGRSGESGGELVNPGDKW